jgi:Spy/CpxP family protein refolding chaperone
LDLDETQKNQVQILAKDLQTEFHRHRETRLGARQAALTAFRSEQFDEAAVQVLLDGHLEDAQNFRGLLMVKIKDLHALLRPEQREKLVQLLEKRMHRKG